MEDEICTCCGEILITDGIVLQDLKQNETMYFCDWDCLEEHIEGRLNQKEEEQ